MPRSDVFDDYLTLPYESADGFDSSPCRRVETSPRSGMPDEGNPPGTPAVAIEAAVNPGEEWVCATDGSGSAQVRSIGNGRVLAVLDSNDGWGRTATVEHTFYENEKRRTVSSVYGRLSSVLVHVGETVRRGQAIGVAGRAQEGGRLHLEVRWDQSLPPTWWNAASGKDRAWIRDRYAVPTEFVRARRHLPVPQREAVLVLVHQAAYKMRVFRFGQQIAEYDVSLGQGSGQKRVQGDNKTPKGMYFVTDKRRGVFPGPYGAYYGGHWIKINYPNRFDAERGVASGLVTATIATNITAAWERRAPTDERTRLGGGIGFHGWNREWANTGPRHLSWGCVVMHLSDIATLYDQVPVGAMVVIF